MWVRQREVSEERLKDLDRETRPSSLTVHALERQEPSALLQFHILLKGKRESLQAGNDLLHLPPGKAESAKLPAPLQVAPI